MQKKRKYVLYSVLVKTVFILITVIAAGTLFSFLKKEKKTEKQDKEPSLIRGNKSLYTDLGRLRAVTSEKQAATVVIFPVLEYNTEDTQFREELVQKKEQLRTVILNWFSQKDAVELYTMPEQTVKKELLEAVNSILNLSKIQRIYFKEFIILE
ncbi:flagellar basal body-associated FliL family protein [Treponema pedis]|uniref:Flagellar protein FliL n=2 Tax=Treponema pedis TaxID=409322 RepID=S5ZV80_9SPIR|nr:flagellar basal body-associated FliL family protein [Treponema pedis]AGT44155.1 flagellar protein FliL-like protein [Treponema pedis str. T A4]QSI04871.1 flagellar basal body protein FliL [Treponema pedis]